MADISSPDDPCPICLCTIDHVAVISTCNHRFCYGCITKWAKSKLHCPMCKASFDQIQHTPSTALPHITHTESLPPPVLPLVDSSLPDLECLTDIYFLGEISRLLSSAEQGKREILRSGKKHLDDYGYQRLNRVLQRLNDLKFMFETELNVDPDLKYSPCLVLTELYQIEAVLQLLRSGRLDELAISFPESDQSSQPVRRYGADDYQQFEEDELDDQPYPYPTTNRGPSTSNGTRGGKGSATSASRKNPGRINRKVCTDDYDDDYDDYY